MIQTNTSAREYYKKQLYGNANWEITVVWSVVSHEMMSLYQLLVKGADLLA